MLLDETAESLKTEIPAVFRTQAMQARKAEPIKAGKGELLCPKCKAGLLTKKHAASGSSFYGCARYGEGCTFSVQCGVAKKPISEKQIKELCSASRNYRTGLVEGFTSKSGKLFSASLVLNPAADWKVEFAF